MADPLPSPMSGLPARGQAEVSAVPPPGFMSDVARWREAWRVRREHPRWAVLWSAPADRYVAFRRSRKQRGTIVTAVTPADLTAQIERAEQRERAGPERTITTS